ncbi:putative phospholipase/carboxylesterase [Saccharata proteae CBS 121410]|uniref:Phospholipase/carboxylesterase n=1 Tax=Saccharata proteae CBS 121410 TaxID=1314787 RepID=A0A9P4I264_9PEZI|nr:putative phospholipase/carboxylesterase [Saccharata proteae CBS 121410]
MPRPHLLACFHGGGSNAEIYAIQCARLSNALSPQFTLHFFDAPFIRSAGPGVLPIFVDYAPFRTWLRVIKSTDESGAEVEEEVGDGSGYDDAETDGVERVLRLMAKVAPLEEWVGVMGFSQGTRVAGGLLLDQQRREERGLESRTRLKFGVLCMGGRTPLLSKVAKETTKSESMDTPDDSDKIAIPTLHLHGLKDEYLPHSRRQLATYFKPETTTLYEIDYHHAMPWVTDEINRLAEMIREKAGA